MRRRLKLFLIVAAALLVAGAIPFLLPLETWRGTLESQASQSLGREVRIKGPLHLTLYPEIGVTLTNVSIANAPGARAPEMARVARVVAGAKLMPLLAGRLQVTDIVLEQPVITLEASANGIPNWRLGSGQPAAANAPLPQAGFSHIRIANGLVRYTDARANTRVLQDVNFDLAMPESARATLALPLTLAGTLTYNGESLALNGKIDNLASLLTGKPVGAHLTLAAPIANADFTGTIGGGLSGEVKLGTRSLRKLAAWAGKPLPPGNGFGLIALESGIAVHGGVVALTKAHAAFDSMNLNGDLAFDLAAPVPAVKGSVSVDRLDINPYLAPGEDEDTAKAVKAAKAVPDAPLALDGLKRFDADVMLTARGLVTPDFTLDHAVIALALHGGILKADVSALSLYGGTGKGNFSADLTGAVPRFHETFDMTGIKAEPFLENFAGVKRIGGTGTVHLDLTAAGHTPKEIVRSLAGKGDARLTDGAIAGADLAAAARLVQSVLTPESLTSVVGGNAKTPFSQLGGTFTIAGGVLKTDNLVMTSDVIQMNGRGTVDLADRTMEFHFQPKPAKPLGGARLAEIGIPFFVKGSWTKPDIGPDTRGLAKALVDRLTGDGTNPLEALTKPGLSLKSLLGTGKSPRN